MNSRAEVDWVRATCLSHGLGLAGSWAFYIFNGNTGWPSREVVLVFTLTARSKGNLFSHRVLIVAYPRNTSKGLWAISWVNVRALSTFFVCESHFLSLGWEPLRLGRKTEGGLGWMGWLHSIVRAWTSV